VILKVENMQINFGPADFDASHNKNAANLSEQQWGTIY
jgi:hypothetical protein